MWSYNAFTYKIGYHNETTENWLERNQSLNNINTIQTPYLWGLLILIPLTFSFDRHFLTNKKAFIKTLTTVLIPLIITIGILTFNYYIIQRHPSVEFNG